MEIFSSLDLRNNNISSICKSFAKKLHSDSPFTKMNINNVQELRLLEEIRLSKNPYHCDCEMTWMMEWLNNFTAPAGKHITVDYKHLKCFIGMMVGKPIYNLDKVEMGCYPPELILWQKIVISLSSGVVYIIIVGLAYLVIKRSRDIKFFLYYYCKWCTCMGVPKDDKNEKLNNMEYDAYLSSGKLSILSVSSIKVND